MTLSGKRGGDADVCAESRAPCPVEHRSAADD